MRCNIHVDEPHFHFRLQSKKFRSVGCTKSEFVGLPAGFCLCRSRAVDFKLPCFKRCGNLQELRLCAASRPVAARADKTSLLMETQTISSHLQLSISLEQIHPARVLLNVWCGGFSSHLELFTPRDSPFSTSPQLLDTSHNLRCIYAGYAG